jgi:CheY-like chemotaxis protein
VRARARRRAARHDWLPSHAAYAKSTINARDAMPRGGTIRVDVRAVRDPDEPGAFGPAPPAGEFVRIAVADEGTGIDAATLERIFEPFFTTKAKGKGTGLGLAMVYGIVSQSQGHIAVSSTVGIGTELRLYFPVCASAATADAAPRSEGPRTSARRATVLVVDDERLVGEVARRILEHAGHAVVIAGGGAEALALAATRRFDLVLCDVVMPEVSGPEVAARLAASADGPPVLFMSGHADADLGAESKLVVTDYLRKPFSSAALPAKVDALLELAGRPRERGKGAELAVTA